MKKEDKIKTDIGTCGICHLVILHTDDYVHVEDYIKGMKHGEWNYHRACFREKISGKMELKNLQSMAKNIMERADTALSGMGI